MRFTNAKTRRIARLVRILGKDSLEVIFGSQVTVFMLRPLRYHQLRLARLEKPGGKDRRAPNNSGLEYGIKVPSNAKEAFHVNQDNCNKLLANAILEELEALMSMKLFRKLPLSLCKSRAKVFQFAPLWMISDVKVDI